MGHIPFKVLSATEEEEFREYARENDPPKMEDWECYHPVCREEWVKRGLMPLYVGSCENPKCSLKMTFKIGDPSALYISIDRGTPVSCPACKQVFYCKVSIPN